MDESGATEKDQFVMKEPMAALERAYIEEYLRGKGLTLRSLRELPEERAKQFMREATLYASTKLAEVEKRARLIQDFHDYPQA